MLRNYLKIAFRTLWKNKAFSFINLLGLAVGMTASVLIVLWIGDEVSFDQFHANRDTLYRVIARWKMTNETEDYATTPAPLAPAVQQAVPEVKNAARFAFAGRMLVAYRNQVFDEKEGAMADPSFLQMFSFPLLKGNSRTALTNPKSIVMSETVAKKYFGTEEPLGKIIRLNNKYEFTVTGVMRDVPANSHLRFGFLIPFVFLKEGGASLDANWNDYNYFTYVELHPGASPAAAGTKITGLLKKREPDNEGAFYLQALPAIYLDSTVQGNGEAHGDAQYVYIFSAVAIFILLIACINYMNLSTARSAKRAKEVGLRKVAGAYKAQLVGQFLGESVMLSLLAMVLALFLVWLLLPVYNDLTGKQLSMSLLIGTTALGLLIIALLTGILAGSYPALMLSSFQPVKVLKGAFKGVGGSAFRKGLVVTQFTLSIMLIGSTLIISRQLTYIRSKNLGYQKENILAFAMRGEIGARYESVKEELERQPGVLGVTSASDDLSNVYSSTSGGEWEGKTPNTRLILNQLSVDRDFTRTFDIPMVEGRGFQRQMKTDSNAFILNEEAVRRMGLRSPVGKRFSLHDITGTVIGVAKDFHFKSLHEPIEPMVLFVSPNWRAHVYVKLSPGAAESVVASVEKVWKAYNPAYPFEYRFLNENFDRMYRTEQRTSRLFNYFSFITIFIACLGLFGLAAYTAEQRTKEIGIRKVLGASVPGLIVLLSKEFLKLVLLALLVATPVSWYIMSRWLEDFAYKTEIEWWMFALAGLLAVAIALLTVSFQSVKTALMNPVKSLKSE